MLKTDRVSLKLNYHVVKKSHFWIWSYLLQSEFNNEKSMIRLDPTGVIDNVELKILNLNQYNEWKQVSGQPSIFILSFIFLNHNCHLKIGTWYNKKLTFADIVWPGLQPKPPLGRPDKFHLKIVTIEEPPFVIYKNTSEDGTCSTSSVLVQVFK